MDMCRGFTRRAEFYALDPLVLDDVLDLAPQLGIWLQHPAENRSGVARGEVRDGLRHRRGRGGTRVGVCGVERIGHLCDAPGELLEVEAVVYDCASPDVDETRVVWDMIKLLRSDVRLTSTKSRGHVDGRLPRQPVHRGCTVISNLGEDAKATEP